MGPADHDDDRDHDDDPPAGALTDTGSGRSLAAIVLDEMRHGGAGVGRGEAAVGRGSAGSRGWRASRRAGLGLGVTAVAVAAAVVVLGPGRRPPPIEERLPVAGTATSVAGKGAAPTSDAAAPEGRDDRLVVHVAGGVARPGVVQVAGSARVVDAVDAAGGLTPDADVDRINMAALLADGQRVLVPRRGQPDPVEVGPAPAPVPRGPGDPGDPGGGGGGGGTDGATGSVDLNTATAEVLETLPGVGPATAAAIIQHREEEGPFGSVDSLLDVRGIGEAKLEAVRDLVVVSGSR